jgi:hypothetical protein
MRLTVLLWWERTSESGLVFVAWRATEEDLSGLPVTGLGFWSFASASITRI